jgi:hypothetical protein
MTTAVKVKKSSSEVQETGSPSQPEKPIMEYNNKTFQSWTDLMEKYKIENITIPHGVSAPEGRKRDFLSRVDLEQGPIERKVMTMVRFKAKNRDDKEPKEYLKYTEDWQAKDWMGRKLRNSENEEGVYYEQQEEKIIKYDETKGPQIAGYKRSGEHTVYTIPFSKAAVDKIIGDQDKSDIIFVVKSPPRKDHFNYDEFTNYSWEQCEKILLYDGGVQMARADRLFQSGKTGNDLNFKPS